MAESDGASILGVCVRVFILYLFYVLALSVHRLYLSPLAKFPGPKLAAWTKWYEFYYEIVLKGQFTFHIQSLHKQYGPIIRINPHELHVEDPDYWEELYARSANRDKYEVMSGQFDNPTSVFATSDHDLHRIRRAALNPMFSHKQIHERISAFAGDIITQFAFAKCYNHLESQGFEETFHESFMAAGTLAPLTVHFPWIKPVMKSMPEWFVFKVQPLMVPLFQMQRDIRNVTRDIVEGKNQNHKDLNHPTVFRHLLDSDLPPQEKSLNRLHDEATVLVAGGFATTAWALSVGSFYIINSPSVFQMLPAELVNVIPDPTISVSLQDLERLPYLNACTREALRMSYGLSSRNPRISPREPMKYRDWTIPSGTPVSMTSVDVHHDETIFPDSHSFKPERWLNNPRTSNGSALDRYLVSFGKGGRSCLGNNLALAELHLALATVFRRFSFELYETDVSDVTLAHDCSLPSPKLDTKGVRVRVKTDELQAS
ncbi:hypothetical protein MMC28_001395 [Mycoblastus sanguinarius]|nr:hypothetical protein [Mycoblastus sanguinarius]